MVKNLPVIQETQVRSLGQEDSVVKEMATHSSIPAWKIPWTEEPGGLRSIRVTKSQTRLSDFTFTLDALLLHREATIIKIGAHAQRHKKNAKRNTLADYHAKINHV